MSKINQRRVPQQDAAMMQQPQGMPVQAPMGDMGQQMPDMGSGGLLDVGGHGVGLRLSDSARKADRLKAQQELMPDYQRNVDADRCRRWNEALEKYRAGKKALDARIVIAEDFWKLRHWRHIRGNNPDNSPEPASGWLVNVILSKHSDAVDAYPEPVCLPREETDKPEAQALSDILPVVLQQNDFEQVWSDVWWYKLKSGTGVYGVFWDPEKLHGLGDISIEKVDILNLFWEPGVKNIQDSKHMFYVHLEDNEALEEQYPQLEGKLADMGRGIIKKYRYDDNVDTQDKSAVIDVYYKRRGVLHYAKYVGETVLFCTEDDVQYAEKGLYDHGKYPFVFDPLFPEEGYPGCGYGYVDLCRDPQITIDVINNAFVKSTVAAATPRWFVRSDGGVNAEEYLDLTKPMVHVSGNLGEESVRQIITQPMPNGAIEFLNLKVQEMKETSGNRDANNGGRPAGVNAASAIAALQEAGNGLSRDMIEGAYRAFRKVVELSIELMRQFYDLPRQFRILGAEGQEKFIRYDNSGLQGQQMPVMGMPGMEPLERMPVFDIDVQVQSEAQYTKQAYNELAIQLYQLGIFNPENAVQAAPMLEMMDFKGKSELLQKVQMNGMLQQELQQWQQMAVALAQKSDPAMAQGLAQAAGMQAPAAPSGGSGTPKGGAMTSADSSDETWQMKNARENAAGGAIPR